MNNQGSRKRNSRNTTASSTRLVVLAAFASPTTFRVKILQPALRTLKPSHALGPPEPASTLRTLLRLSWPHSCHLEDVEPAGIP